LCRLVVILREAGLVVGDSAGVGQDLTEIRKCPVGAVLGDPLVECGGVGVEKGAVLTVKRVLQIPEGVIHSRPVLPVKVVGIFHVAEQAEPAVGAAACQSGQEVVGRAVVYGNRLSGRMEAVTF